MNSSMQRKSQERILKSPSNGKLNLQEGIFSKQHSILAQMHQIKPKYSTHQQKQSKTTSELPFPGNDTHSPPKPFQSKFHFNSLSQLTKLECNLSNNIQKNDMDTSADFGELSIRLKEKEEVQIHQILNNFKLVGEKMSKTKPAQVNQIILLQWRNTLSSNCDKLIKYVESKKQAEKDIERKKQKSQDLTSLQQQLAEEKKNRLLVEEQTSKIIASQESQIVQYVFNKIYVQIETVKLLEQQLLRDG